ncbi:MAG: hypothetical protein LBR10_10960 [Prevotellaceae bacterium]|nr:hypothetical protein [Prevotellaceae bacterium]
MKYCLFICGLLFISCSQIRIEENPLLFFWEEMDKKYVYFEEKQINWDSVKNTLHLYNPDNDSDLLSGFTSMINTIKDGHVWIATDETVITFYDSEYYNNPVMELDIYDAGNLIDTDVYTIAQLKNNTVYVAIKTFLKPSSSAVTELVNGYNYSNGIIMDIRNNTGGYIECVLDLASCFIKGNHNVLYTRHKKSRKHDDFTDYKPISVVGKNLFGDVKLVIITDKRTYSAPNSFVSIMRNFTNTVLVGNKTGGGGAQSCRSILPNGWGYSISENPHFDVNFKSLEPGVEPDYLIVFGEQQYDEYQETGIHCQMEFAFQLLNQLSQ